LNKEVSLTSINPLSVSMSKLIELFNENQVEKIYLGANFARVYSNVIDRYNGPAIESVKKFVIGSGAISWEIVQKFKKLIPPDAEFMHSYGATEAVGMLSGKWKMSNIPEFGKVPLGTVAESRGIKFEQTEQAGVFQVLATQRIARRYLLNSQTLEKFVTLDDGTKCWKSGDLVRFEGKEKTIFHEGRVDDIVKNSDHLVSLFSVEREINNLSFVEACAVRKLPFGDRELIVAFVQAPNQNTRTVSQVMFSLKKKIPSYSIPHRIIVCEKLPLTNRGKPDSAQLVALLERERRAESKSN
jgi:acyl-coenzyme A synthetase/AMP-(fatty) acid ligase